uniref:non-specific serine/threonine protein kinase n=1 Tax=Fibrocapsa japonica TaxID=94617 RepID=A0A7S2XV40_9STRA|mmetsp:Transcript_12078/g.17804  ORF Transcript_12078/g.17804 Transcript_12078/m.17804 type:complete len:364 (+) Transcript_12078:156-1247(+)|eukprot:CAMPEP_0113943916 /NCGR_PEP_ID=MMETSP1339-20121228/29488_1 /TAXON_ID=94617 /ORGANISM="Fibrocapsa japonica" /LENGTH=363 /DNA_ID=CAMNT_0000948921 /DNA_START=156 /DNA_END=1247 /DNA_ORIENTATION=+ /assembly_acc=CAM_ASM_000762
MGCSSSTSASDAVTSKESETGASFDKSYKLLKELGSGSFSTVREGVSKLNGERFAVKIVKRMDLPPDDEEALIEEVTILKHVDHPNIIKLYEFFEEKHFYYLVIELMEGGELFDRIVQKTYYNEKEARDLVHILLSAIKFCHDNGIVHRDLKPENLLLTSSKDDASIKIADFGFARQVKESNNLTTQCGTPGYVAPEILNGVPYGLAVDMWSIGVITYILLGGYPPFHDEKQSNLFAKIRAGDFVFHPEYWDPVSEEAKDLIRKLLTVDPNKRITAAEAMQHPWVTGADETLAARNLDSQLRELRRFNARRKFRSGVKAIVAANRMQAIIGGLKAAANTIEVEAEAEKSKGDETSPAEVVLET